MNRREIRTMKKPALTFELIFVYIFISIFLFGCNRNSEPKPPPVPVPEAPEATPDKPPGSVSNFEKSWIGKHVKSGMVVADIGCGGGRLTFLMAKEAKKKGKVYALDIDDKVLIQIKRKVIDKQINQYRNVTVKKNTLSSTTLPSDSVDLSFIVASLWHARIPLEAETKQMLKSIFDTTKPGGELHVINGPFPPNEIINENETTAIVNNFSQAGFMLKKKPFVKENHRLILLKKPNG